MNSVMSAMNAAVGTLKQIDTEMARMEAEHLLGNIDTNIGTKI